MNSIYAILLLPPFTSLFIIILRKYNFQWIGVLSVVSTLFSLVLSILVDYSSLRIDWVTMGNYTISFVFVIDNIALLMLFIVNFIALLVQIYSLKYINEHEDRPRYFALLQFFLFSIIGITLSQNLILTYFFWELVGISSYLLIGFWYKKETANQAAKKAFIINRIGDTGFLIGILLVNYYFKTTDVLQLRLMALNSQDIIYRFGLNSNYLTLVGILLFCGTIGKSAQWPLSAWLPDAMEGPTPVSALIHAATMVAAGVFLLVRISFLFTDEALLFVVAIGTITMFLGAYRAIHQTQLKRVLAFSTVSQLGLMVVAVGIGNKEIALFHLTTHAFFKAGLFLCAGIILHQIEKNNFKLTSLRQNLPFTFICFTICGFSLIGIPLTSGFLSKDLILIEVFHWAETRGTWFYIFPILAMVSVFFTAVYMAKTWKNLFVHKNDNAIKIDSYEKDLRFKVPILLLAILSLFVWFSLNPFKISSDWTLSFIFQDLKLSENHFVMVTSVIVSVIGIFVGLKINVSESKLSLFLAGIYDIYLLRFLNSFLNLLQIIETEIIDRTVLYLANGTVIFAHLAGKFDKISVDGIINGLASTTGFVGNKSRFLQNGKIQNYWTIPFIFFIVFLLIWIVK